VVSIKEIVDKQFNMEFNKDELLNSNILVKLLEDGGLLQIDSDTFILLIGPKKPFIGDIKSLSSNQFLVYQPDYWDYLEQNPPNKLYVYQHNLKLNRADLRLLLSKIQLEGQSLQFRADHYDHFKTQYDWSQKQFENGLLKKTVPFTKFEYQIEDRFNFLTHLLFAIASSQQGWLYGFWNSQQGYMGMTPESLALWDGDQLETMALAGTWSHDVKYNNLDDIDEKIKQEHDLVIQDIISKVPQAKKDKTKIFKLQYLNHLKTKISCEVKDLKFFFEYVLKLHPTAALGLFPHNHELALNFSKLNLQNQRGFFGAPIGFLTSKRSQIYVSIRCFEWNQQKQKLNIFCGCGITQQSVISEEWNELNTKKMAIVKAFNLQIQQSKKMEIL